MKYSDNFTKQLFKYCKYETINKIDKLISEGKNNSVRIALENDLDDPTLYNKGKVSQDKLQLFKGRQMVYSLFMEEYTKELDKKKYESHNRR